MTSASDREKAKATALDIWERNVDDDKFDLIGTIESAILSAVEEERAKRDRLLDKIEDIIAEFCTCNNVAPIVGEHRGIFHHVEAGHPLPREDDNA